MNKCTVLLTISVLTGTLLLSCAGCSKLPPAMSSASLKQTTTSEIEEMQMAMHELATVRETQLVIDGLPVEGSLKLDPANEKALIALGLGGSCPVRNPPYFPYSENGLYWSESFSLNEGDILEIAVYSYTTVSWFGVDWSRIDVRGVLAFSDVDEDGWNFNPVYPVNYTVGSSSNITILKLSYAIDESGDYQVVVKNSNAVDSRQLFIAVSSKHQADAPE